MPNERESGRDDGAGLGGDADERRRSLSAAEGGRGSEPDNELGIGPLSLAIQNGSLASSWSSCWRQWRRPEPGARERRDAFDDGGAAGAGRRDGTLLAKGRGEVDARERKFGQTALMWAAGNPEAVRLLLERAPTRKVTTKTWDVKYTIYAADDGDARQDGHPVEQRRGLHQQEGRPERAVFRGAEARSRSRRGAARRRVGRECAGGRRDDAVAAALYKWDSAGGYIRAGAGRAGDGGELAAVRPDFAMAVAARPRASP
jgi:hypothetical protein